MKFNSITTERLVISLFKVTHISDVYISWLNDQKLMQFSEQRHKRHTTDSCREYFESFKDTDNLFLAIEDLHGSLLGTLTVYYNPHNSLADIGIMIGAKSIKGLGFGFEAWDAISQWSANNLNIKKLSAGCMATNTKMIKIMKDSGMTEDGKRVKHYLSNDAFVDLVYFAKFI
jgi:RimJ/RimL family protein N-acetyltransferase